MARLAQSVERKALNLVVVGSSPTVGVLFVCHRGNSLHDMFRRQSSKRIFVWRNAMQIAR